MADRLAMIHLDEFLFTSEEIAKRRRGTSFKDNLPFFRVELRSGWLDRYFGKYVVYKRGTFCGSSKDGELLLEEATSSYGEADLAMFRVPTNREAEPNLEEARGHY